MNGVRVGCTNQRSGSLDDGVVRPRLRNWFVHEPDGVQLLHHECLHSGGSSALHSWVQPYASAIDRKEHFEHKFSQPVIRSTAQWPCGLACQIVEREQTDQDSVPVDYRDTPGVMLAH